MNKSLLIVLVPALLVAVGYIVVLRMMGLPPGYGRLAVAMFLFFGVIFLLARKSAKKAKSAGPSAP
jgi:hypothetical protein